MKNPTLNLCLLLFVFFGLTANATTYYVSLNGNDANSGTLMTSPWKTIAKINRSTFLPGDSILFRKGDTWREQLTLPSSGSLGNLITFGAYGSGAKPIINAADVMTGWTNIGSNLWYIISPNVVPTRAMVVIGGIIYAEVASLAACNSGNKYFIDISTNRLYVFSIVDPGTLTAEVSKREYCIVTASGINSKRFIEIDDIEVRYAGNSGICFEGPGTSLGAAFNGSSFVRRCTAYANNLDGIVHRDHYDNFTVEDCDASYNGNGFYSWIADGGTFRRCTSSNQIQYNVTFTDGEAFGGYQSDNWLVENCVSNSDYDAIHIDAGGRSLNAIIRYNKVYNSSSGLPATPGMGVGSLGVGGSIKIYYNLIVNCASNGFECYTDMIGKCEYYNNTIYENTSTGSNSGIYLKNAANFIFKNNIIVRDYVQYKTLFLIEVLPNISTNDYNLYYILNDPGTHFRAYFGAYYSTLATWQAATGQDAHSLSSNPLFKNVLSDWSLQPGSPCINTGVDVGLTRDILGNPIVGLPDMGAYEYTTANANPIANAGNDISLTLPVTVATLNGSAVDPDGTIASYSWSRISGPTTFTLGNGNAATTTLSNLVEGVYVFKLTVTDNQGASASDNITVTVNAPVPPLNQPPVANAGNDINLTLPVNSTTLKGSAVDPDGTIASYSWSRVSGPGIFSLTNSASAITTVTGLTTGIYVFRLTVTDNDGAIDADDVTMIVNAAPQPPVANAGNDINLTLPGTVATLNGSAVDPDGTIASYSWSRMSGPTTFTLGNENAATTTLSNLVEGVYVFKLTVTDNQGASASDNITVTVNAPVPPLNQPPVANAGNDINLTLPVTVATLNGSAVDPDGTIASYSWSRVSGPGIFSLTNSASAITTVTGLTTGIYVFRLTVTDNDGAIDADDVTVIVNTAPQPPVANAGKDISLTLPVNSTTLKGSAVDPDGTIASYSWSRVSGPTTFTLGNENAATTALSNLVEGVYVFKLTVTDNQGASASDNITVTVNAPVPPLNQPPVANAGNDINLTLPVNSTTLNGSAVDPDGIITTYSWSRASGPTTFTLGNENAATTTLSNLVEGVYAFNLTVTDNQGASVSDNITVTVNAPIPPLNQPPVADAGPDQTITLPANSVTLSGSDSYDPDGVISGYQWQQIDGPGTSTISSTTSDTINLSNLTKGTYIFKLVVRDNGNATDADSVIVTVLNKSATLQTISLYPDPATNIINISFNNDSSGIVRFNIYDMNGIKAMAVGEVDMPVGLFTSSIDVTRLATSVYTLEVIMSSYRRIMCKFVKL